MAFATNTDLENLVSSVFEHGVDDWSTELSRAEEDVLKKIQIEWYDRRYSGLNWDATNLVESQWTTATCYRALAYYIMPKLSGWRPEGDSFREQIEFYSNRYAEEMNDQFAIGIQYDRDDDGTVTESETYPAIQNRLWR